MLGNKEVKIIEQDDETSIIMKDTEKDGKEKTEKDDDSVFEGITIPSEDIKKFKGHWAGFEFGLNNYVDKDFSLTRTPENEFMDINTGKSWNFNLNFYQYSIPVLSNRFGIVSGMGLEWSNYHFSNLNTINKIDGSIQVDSITYTDSPKKNRFQTTYLTVPLLVELQLLDGKRKDRIYLAGGVIGGIKLFSNTKVVYSDGNRQNLKKKDDYYLRPLRYAVTARAGYKMVKLYFNYYMTSLFLQERGPELYPFATGLAITF
jgi:hypothetical protein